MLTQSNLTKGWRVLVGTPTSDKKLYCQDDFISNIKSFTYPHDCLIVDNSADRKNYKKIMKDGIKAIHVKPNNRHIYSVLAESHEELRKYAIRNDYDYLLHLESDVFPPSDVIQRLLIHDKQIISAMYMVNFGKDSNLMAQEIEEFGELRETRNLKDGQDLQLIDGGVKEIFHCGLGCILIRRDVLEKIEFRWEKGASVAPDSHLHTDLSALGYTKFIETSVLCTHKNDEFGNLNFK